MSAPARLPESARRSYLAGDYDRSLKELEKAREKAKARPLAPEWRLLEARVRRLRGEAPGGYAEQPGEGAEAGSTGDALLEDYFLEEVARGLEEQGERGPALKLFERIRKNHSESLPAKRALLRIGDLELGLGRPAEAARSFKQALRTIKDRTQAAKVELRLASALEQSGRPVEAASVLERLWIERPETEGAERAAAELERLSRESGIRLKRPSWKTSFERAERLFSRFRYEKALAVLEVLYAEADRSGDLEGRVSTRMLIGRCRFRQRDYPAAAVDFERAYRAPVSAAVRAEALTRWAWSELRAGRGALAASLFERSAERFSGLRWGKEAAFRLGRVLEEERGPAAAEAAYRDFLRAHPRSSEAPEARWRLAWLAYQRARPEEAIENLASLRRSSSDAWRRRAAYWEARFREEGDPAEAKRLYRTLLSSKPANYYVGRARARLGALGAEVPAAAGFAPSSRAEAAMGETKWSNSSKRTVSRARALLRIGFEKEAREELGTIKSAKMDGPQAVELSRLLAGAGDYHGSQRVVRRKFGPIFERPPLPDDAPLWRLAYPRPHLEAARAALKKGGLEGNLLYAVMRAESTYRSEIESPAGAVGLMQIMPQTGERFAGRLKLRPYGLERLYEPETSIRIGAHYLGLLLERYKGRLPYALAAYNAGESAVDRWISLYGGLSEDGWIESIPYRETRRYVKKVLGSYGVYAALYPRP